MNLESFLISSRSYALTTGAKDGFKLFVVKTHSEMKERTTFENKSRRT
jgi:hypothetical protein